MHMPRTRRHHLVAPALAGLLLLVGCNDEKKTKETTDAGTQDAGPKPALGGKLGAALREVASANANPSAEAGGGPPPTGIFGAGDADKVLSQSAPPKVEVLGDGEAPRVTLTSTTPSVQEKIPFVLVLGLGGKSILPPLAIELLVGPEGAPAKDEKKTPGAKDVAAKPAAPTSSSSPPDGPPRIIATLGTVAIAQGGDRAPKELLDAVAKLKGSSISFVLTKTGPIDVQRHLAKDAEKQLDLHLRAIAEALSSLYVPVPDKPMGKGGYWMVTDRIESLGLQVVRYRVFKVTDVRGDNVSMTVEVKQYAVNDKVDLPELGQQLEGLTLGRYLTQGKAVLDLAPGHVFAGAASFQLAEQLGFGPQGKQALPVQIAAQIGANPPKGLAEQAPPPQPGGPQGGGPEDEPPLQ